MKVDFLKIPIKAKNQTIFRNNSDACLIKVSVSVLKKDS